MKGLIVHPGEAISPNQDFKNLRRASNFAVPNIIQEQYNIYTHDYKSILLKYFS